MAPIGGMDRLFGLQPPGGCSSGQVRVLVNPVQDGRDGAGGGTTNAPYQASFEIQASGMDHYYILPITEFGTVRIEVRLGFVKRRNVGFPLEASQITCYHKLMSNLSSEAIDHLARLARLAISEEEKNRYAGQLSPVVEYVEQLSRVNTEVVAGQGEMSDLVNVLAADQPRSETDPAKVDPHVLLAGAPVSEEDFFVVRAVLGEEIVSA